MLGFHVSVLLLRMNFVIPCQISLWIHSYTENVVMKFIINNRTDEKLMSIC